VRVADQFGEGAQILRRFDPDGRQFDDIRAEIAQARRSRLRLVSASA
jgi:hypothetical protein